MIDDPSGQFTPYLRRQMTLYPEKFGYMGAFSREMLEVAVSEDFLRDQMLVRFTTSVLSGKTLAEEPEISLTVGYETPDTWWQHLKQSVYAWNDNWLANAWWPWLLLLSPLVYMIPWWKNRHPVRYLSRTVTGKGKVKLSQKILYPYANYVPAPTPFGMPVIYEEMEMPELAPDGGTWGCTPGPSRYVDRHELVFLMMRDPAIDDYSFSYADLHPHRILEWLGRHGVNPDQLVRRSQL